MRGVSARDMRKRQRRVRQLSTGFASQPSSATSSAASEPFTPAPGAEQWFPTTWADPFEHGIRTLS